MLTVSTLARRCGVSRTTVLYYESAGLLKAARRTAANYRVYGERELQRLQMIRVYRAAGLPVGDIRALLDRFGTDASAILRRRLVEIDAEIARLRGHQQAIARLLPGAGAVRRRDVITKDKWVAIMKKAGFSDRDMHNWHAQFELSAPAEHQEFLEFLHIPPDEIRAIRTWSRKSKSEEA
jgi:DNA-binding transcriptional MerR regulator